MKKVTLLLSAGSVLVVSGVVLYLRYVIVGQRIDEDRVLQEEFAAGALGAIFTLAGLSLVGVWAIVVLVRRRRDG